MQSVGFYALTLVGKTREYAQVYSFQFQPATAVDFVPGQYVHLLAPGSPPGRENIRHLSIASIPEEGPLRFTVDLDSSSDYKKKLGELEIGGQAHLFKVKGHFVLGDTPPAQMIFLAGGIGITPIRALLKHIEAHHGSVDWRLAHVSRDSYLYESELASLPGEQKRIRRHEVADLVARWTKERPAAQYYVSGSARFVEGISALLKEHGIPDEAVRVENFE